MTICGRKWPGSRHHDVHAESAADHDQRSASRRALYQLTLQSVNLNEIYEWAPKLIDKMRALPGFVDVNSDMQIASPEVMLDIDRDRALALGVTPQQIQNALASALAAREVSTIYAPANQYSVILELEPKYQRNPELCRSSTCVHHRARWCRSIRWCAMKRNDRTAEHQPLRPVAGSNISFNLKPGFSLGEAADQVERMSSGRRAVPATISDELPGHREGIPEVVPESVGAC